MKQIMQPLYWNPARLKELKQRGLKLKYYKYDIRMRDKTIEELENERASERAIQETVPHLSLIHI